MKKISVFIPCFNEVQNVGPISRAVTEQFSKYLPEYDYEILFEDNHSTDGTRDELRKICAADKHIKAIFNVQNFGQFNSPYHGLCQTSGDCSISMCCDFQDPVELIPNMVHEWERGHKVVCMVKKTSRENHFIYLLRTIYYKMLRRMTPDIRIIEHFTGFGLYDKSFVDILRSINDPAPFMRGIVAEYAPEHLEIPYEQQKRKAGKTKNNFFTLFDAAMLSFTSYTKLGLRLATFIGMTVSFLSFLVSIYYFVMKLLHWNDFPIGNAPMVIGVFFLGGLQIFFIGLVGEYIMSINTRVINRPLVVEEERINF